VREAHSDSRGVIVGSEQRQADLEACIRYLTGERVAVPTPTPQPIYDGMTPAEVPEFRNASSSRWAKLI
jgi:hypothetical protein